MSIGGKLWRIGPIPYGGGAFLRLGFDTGLSGCYIEDMETDFITASQITTAHILVWRDNQGNPELSTVTKAESNVARVAVSMDNGSWHRSFQHDDIVEIVK